MRVGGGQGTSALSEAQALEAARKAAEEAARKAAEAAARKAAAEAARQVAEAARKQVPAVSAPADDNQTTQAVTPRGTSALRLERTLKSPEKLAETALENPTVAMEAAAENPGKFTDTLIKGAGLLMGGVVGNEAFQLVKGSLSAQKKVKEIKNLTTKITEAKAQASTLTGATGQALREAAADATKAPRLNALDKLGKLNAGLSVATGVNSALHLRRSVAALKDGATPRELATVAGDALGSLRGADEAFKLAKGVNVGFLGGKINPVLSIAVSGADTIKRVDTLVNDWDQLSTKDKVANFAALGGNLTDIAGSALLLSGVGAPIGVALKGIGAGLSLVSLGIRNFDTLKSAGQKAATFVSDTADDVVDVAKDVGETVADGAKKVASALNPFD